MTTSDPRGVPGDRPLAVVTGASSGIGLELAKRFAEHDFDVVVAAEDPGIETAADVLRAFGSQVLPVRADLSDVRGLRAARRAGPRGGQAGRGARAQRRGRQRRPVRRDRPAQGARRHRRQRDVDVHLAKRIIPDMVERGSGKVLITSSIAATQPGPYEAVYAATKAFDQSFAESIRSELKDSGVTVTSLLPGVTRTNFFHRAEMDDTRAGSDESMQDDPAKGRRAGFRGPSF